RRSGKSGSLRSHRDGARIPSALVGEIVHAFRGEVAERGRPEAGANGGKQPFVLCAARDTFSWQYEVDDLERPGIVAHLGVHAQRANLKIGMRLSFWRAIPDRIAAVGARCCVAESRRAAEIVIERVDAHTARGHAAIV